MPLCLRIRARQRRARNANGLCVNASSPHRYVAILPSRPGESGRRRQIAKALEDRELQDRESSLFALFIQL